ncbi:MAG: hypothetical protein QM784_20445 [Polyangiaceae bacterium]
MNPGSLQRGLLPCLILSLAVAGCSLLYEPPLQCNRDSDCAKRAESEPTLQQSYCENHVCVLPSDTDESCKTHADCLNANSGNPAICRSGACISLLHGECTQVLNSEALKSNNDVILMGAFAPLNSLLPRRDTVLMSYQLAVDEIQANTKGAIGYSDYHERPFVFVACRSDGAQRLSDSFDHLTKTLKVPVVVTNQQATELEEQVARLIGEETNTMFLSPLSSDPALAAMKDRSRLWHMLGTPTDLVPAYAKLLQETMAKLSEPARVLTVVNDVRAMGEIADRIEDTLTINGLSVSDAIKAGTYLRVGVESLALHPEGPKTDKILEVVPNFKPNVVLMLAGPEVVSSIAGIEKRPSEWGIVFPPQGALSHHLVNNDDLRTTLAQFTGIESRIYGINYAGASDRSLYYGYLSRLLAAYPDAYQEEYENFYDSAHYAMLAVIGAAREIATEDLNGDLAVKGFRRLIDKNGAAWSLRPDTLSTISSAILEADADSTIYLSGTLGTPDFSSTGARFSTAALWCLTSDGAGGLSYRSGAVRFDTGTGDFDKPLSDCRTGSN